MQKPKRKLLVIKTANVLQALPHVAQDLARLSVGHLWTVHLIIPQLLRVAIQLFLQLKYIVRRLLVLLLENRLYARALLLVRVCRQLQILVHVF